jgi:hypothetical protein
MTYATTLLCPALALGEILRTGNDFQVNLYATGSQSLPSVGASASGDFVVTWSSYAQDGSDFGVFARRWSATGTALAAEFQINTRTASSQRHPEVAVESDGDFVVAWQGYQQDGVSYGIFARRFSSSGAALAAELQINAFTNNNESNPSVAVDGDGDFVVAWQTFRDGALLSVAARRFDSAGAPQASEFQVNSYTPGNQFNPAVDASPDGRFVIAWESDNHQDGQGTGVFARRFSSTGAAQGTEFPVNLTTAAEQRSPRVAMADDGRFVIAWRSQFQDGPDYGVFARRFDAGGAAQGLEIAVNSHTVDHQTLPAVVMDAAGNFLVVWESVLQDGFQSGIFARSFDASGLAQVSEFQVNGYTASNQSGAALAAHDVGWIVAWTDNVRDGSADGVFAQRLLAVPTKVTFTLGPELQVSGFTADRQQNPDVAADGDGDFVLVWQDEAAEPDGDIRGRRFSSAGAALASEFLVNHFTPNGQTFPNVGASPSGSFVVVWDSVPSLGAFSTVSAKRFNSAGAAQAIEFQVNVYTASNSSQSDVAMDASGRFVVVWMSTRYGSADIIARRHDAAGNPQAVEFVVNAYTLGYQSAPAVASDNAGGFLVAWASNGQDGASGGVFARRFDSAGSAEDEFQVNAYTVNAQGSPAVALDANGDVMIVWSSQQDGSPQGVFGRIYSSTGIQVTPEFQVTSYTVFNQTYPSVAALQRGDFIVSWASYQDGGGMGVFARRFGPDGKQLTSEFQVNVYTTGYQTRPAVAADGTDSFVVAWHSDAQDGDQNGVFARRYGTIAVLDVDGDRTVEPLTDGVLILRNLFGFSGAALINGAVGDDCTRCTADAISLHLAALGLILDIDHDLQVGPLTDGVLALRFLFGFTGTSLISGAVGNFCDGIYCTAPGIESYLASLR